MRDGRSGRRLAVPAISVVAIGAIAAGAYGYLREDVVIPGDASDLDQVAFGSRVYSHICANCHGTKLDGQLGWQEPLKDGTRLAPAHSVKGETWRLSDGDLFNIVRDGGETLKPDGGVSRMPGFGEKLTVDEIWAVIAFIKSTWPTDVQESQQNASMDRTEPR